MPAHFKIHLLPAGYGAELWPLLQSAAIGLYKNNGFGIAKGVAYSGLLAFFPVVTEIAAILVTAKADEVASTIAGLLYEVAPPGTEDVVRTLFVVRGQRPDWLLVAATLLAAWAASGAMISLMEGFRAVYHTLDDRSFLKERGIAMMLVLTSALPVLGASGLIVFGARVEQSIRHWLGGGTGLTGWIWLAGQALRYGAPFASFVVVTMILYYFGPNRKQGLRNVAPGAILATLLWLLATSVFAWYVRNVGKYNVLYGSVGAGLALLVWMYVLAIIALFGCEFNAASEKARQALVPPPGDEMELI